jgi:hypothetical protein
MALYKRLSKLLPDGIGPGNLSTVANNYLDVESTYRGIKHENGSASFSATSITARRSARSPIKIFTKNRLRLLNKCCPISRHGAPLGRLSVCHQPRCAPAPRSPPVADANVLCAALSVAG